VSPQPAESDGALDAGAKLFAAVASREEGRVDARDTIANIRKAEGREKMPPWTLHDLRRTARSLMSRAKVPTDHAERALGHVIGGVRETYDRYEYVDEKRAAFKALAGLVHLILNPADNVVPLRQAD
jgi:integrase